MNKSSVEVNEVAKFDKLSHNWWDKNKEFKILHEINPLRVNYIIKKIDQHFDVSDRANQYSSLNILDVGCGGGLVATALAQKGFKLTGIDASSKNINEAGKHAKKLGLSIDYKNLLIEEMASGTTKYDVVLCLEVIEHVANISNFIKNLSTLVKPGGMLIISTINRNLKSYLQAIVLAEYVLKWVPKQTHEHKKFLKPSELNHFFNQNCLSLQELKGLTFNIFSQNWQLSDNVDVNYFAYAVKES